MTASTDVKYDGLRGMDFRPGAGGAVLIVALVAAAVVFWPGLLSLVDAWQVPEYSHGPIIPLISLFLFLREMRGVPPATAPVTDRWQGVAVAALGLTVGLIGALVRIDDIVTYGMIVWLAGVALTSFGFRRGLLFWPAVLHLVFMLPLPQFMYWQVSVYLQLVSSQIGVALIQAAGIPVFLDGNVIDLGVYQLQVAEACSGLRYLFPMLSFSYVFAVLYQGPVWHKLVLLASAAPITVLMNSFRIGMIGVLVNSYGIEHAEGFLHAFEGWIIFIACVVILFGLAVLLQRLSGDPRPLSETLDIEFSGLGEQLARVRQLPASAALATVAAMTIVAGAAWHMTPARAAVDVPRETLVLFPRAFDGWVGASETLDPRIERVLGADDYFSANFVNQAAGESVNLFIAFYRSQTDGSGIHSPEICIPAGGWEVSRWRRIEVPLASGVTVPVNRAIVQQGLNRQLVYFWFEQRGRRLTSDYAVKALTVRDSVVRNRTDGGIVRLITPIDPRETEADADARLRRFLEPLEPQLARFLPD